MFKYLKRISRNNRPSMSLYLTRDSIMFRISKLYCLNIFEDHRYIGIFELFHEFEDCEDDDNNREENQNNPEYRYPNCCRIT